MWHGPGGLWPSHAGTLDDDAFARRFFGGLVTTCGLEAFGPSGSDRFGSWGDHGHLNQLSAESVRWQVDDERGEVCIEGTIVQARMFGERWVLQRTWTIPFDAAELRLHDIVRNESSQARPHMMLYHCNAGYPLLDERLRVELDAQQTRPRDDRAREGMECWNVGGPPQPGFAEQVFIHTPAAAQDGWARGAFVNDGLNGARGFAIHFRPEQLPACFSWRMLGIGTYVMAIEPANCPTIEGRIAAERNGTLPFVEAGDTRSYDLRFAFLA